VITFKSRILNNILVICYKLDAIMFIGDQLIKLWLFYIPAAKLSHLFFLYIMLEEHLKKSAASM